MNMPELSEEEYRQELISRIALILDDLTAKELRNVYQYISNPIEFSLVDRYNNAIIPIDLYERLKEKYPEEFI